MLAVSAEANNSKKEFPSLRKIIEYTSNGNCIKSKNKTAKNIPIAYTLF